MVNRIQTIALEKLVAHPDNPNQMSKVKFAKLLRNIKRTGRYEPLVVRPYPRKICRSCKTSIGQNRRKSKDESKSCFQIINGHHRCRALKKLGYMTAEVVVWDINDQDTDIMLATLNRLGGSDILDKKLALLKRLNQSSFHGKTTELIKLLPQTASQIKRLTELKISECRKAIENHKSPVLNPMVFFLSSEQQEIVQKALSAAADKAGKNKTKALKNAAALTCIAKNYLNYQKTSHKE
jgi:ParB-like chromosome segregation protein Spo0J